MKTGIIGAGLGGLASACLLARRGHEVTVYERNRRPGGKVGQVETGSYRFDTGPSLLTIPWVVDRLFEECGERLQDHLEIVPVDPICRYWFADGTRFDCMRDHNRNRAVIREWSEADAEAYMEFMDYSRELYRRTRDAYLFNPLYSLGDLGEMNPLDLLRIDAFRTMSQRIDRRFETPYMRQFFKRFATYNGSSPYQAPATLNVIPHVELTMGGFYLRGGMYALVRALYKLADQLGVRFHFDWEVARIEVKEGRACGLRSAGGLEAKCELVLANSDSYETYLELLPEEQLSGLKRRSMKRLEPSCSGFRAAAGGRSQVGRPLPPHPFLFRRLPP
ncbi:MAG: FAD-dependent oxidoreductase [Balneolaceae bacterium]|nr:FAD-dependent oxidoreductase [Balneolaceae bacterium]